MISHRFRAGSLTRLCTKRWSQINKLFLSLDEITGLDRSRAALAAISLEKMNRVFLIFASRRWIPLSSAVLTFLLVSGVLLSLICPDQRSMVVAIIFGILTLLAWMLSVFIYQEVRTHIGGLHDLLQKGSQYIGEADKQITILALAPNIGQDRSPKAFLMYRRQLEQQFCNKNVSIEMIIPVKSEVQNLIESVLHERRYCEPTKKQYRNKASSFFAQLAKNAHGIILSKPPPFTVIYVDDRVAAIINNDTREGFLSIKPYEVQIVKKIIDFIKEQPGTSTGFDLPTTNSTGKWLDPESGPQNDHIACCH